MENKTEDIDFSIRQTTALDTLDTPGIEQVLYGGAKYGGKSVLGCRWSWLRAKEIIQMCNIQPSQYPIPVGFMGRKRGVDFNDTTFETWKRFVPSNEYEIRVQDKEIIIDRRVKICYGGLDDETNVKKFNSAEYGFAFIDQAEEITRDDLALIIGSLRLVVNDVKVPIKVLLTANPAPCFLRDDFILNPNKTRRFIQALPSDNPFGDTEAYVDRLREAFKHRPELVAAYVEGSWDQLEGANSVIQHSWVMKATENPLLHLHTIKKVLACDPSRFGDDETVIYIFKNGELIDEMIFGRRSTMETAGEILIKATEHEVDLILVDEIGIGSGIVDRLREMKGAAGYIMGINGSAKSQFPKKFRNLRAEMMWHAGDMFYHNKVKLPKDMTLIGQLSSPQYIIKSNGIIQIESKNEIKKRLGSSPDRGDAVVMALWGLQYARFQEEGLLDAQPISLHG